MCLQLPFGPHPAGQPRCACNMSELLFADDHPNTISNSIYM